MAGGQKYGGPAFPVHPEVRDDEAHAGMTLRDWFAGQALTALIIKQGNHIQFPNARSTTALVAYQMADEMLGRRGDTTP